MNAHIAPARDELKPACADCGNTLTADEVKYYGATCNSCEGRQFEDQHRAEIGLPKTIRLVLPVMSSNKYWRPVRIGNHITIVPTKEAKQYKSDVKALAMKAGIRNVLLGRLSMTIKLHPHRPLDWTKRARLDPDGWADTVRCIDLGNCEKVLSDALNGIAWLDDSQLHAITLVRCEPDERGERVEVEIAPIVTAPIAPGLF